MYDDTETSSKSSGGGFGRAIKNFFLLVLFLALAFGLLYLVSERNARRYFLVPEDGNLVVKRGIFFPVGEKPYLPEDPSLAEAYAPIPLPPSYTGGKQEFDERAELDRALFRVLTEWAQERIDSKEPDRLERGIAYLRRAELLPIYSEAQRKELEHLRGEVAYFEARQALDQAVQSLEDAMQKLRNAREAGGEKAEASDAFLAAVQQQASALRALVKDLEAGRVPGLRPGTTTQGETPPALTAPSEGAPSGTPEAAPPPETPSTPPPSGTEARPRTPAQGPTDAGAAPRAPRPAPPDAAPPTAAPGAAAGGG